MIDSQQSERDPFKVFSAKHGEFIEAPESPGCFYFEDGAKLSGAFDAHLKSWVEPPEDERELLTAKRLHFQLRLEQEVKAFQSFQQDCLDQAHIFKQNSQNGMASATPPPPSNAVEQLKAGKKRMAELSTRLVELDELLAKLPGAEAPQQHQKDHAQEQRSFDEFTREVMALNP